MTQPVALDITSLLRELGRGARTARSLSREQARGLFAAMLAGDIDELRLGALLIAYRIKGETAAELAGMLDAAQATLTPLPLPTMSSAPVVIASYNGARRMPNLVPLLALSLAARGVPVLVHGDAADGHGRISSASVFAELGVRACTSLPMAAAALEAERFAFVPIDVLSPALLRLLALRERVALRNSAHTVAKLLNPFAAPVLRMVNYTHPPYRDTLFELFNTQAPPSAPGVLLARGTEGEATADPRRQVAVEWLADGVARTVIEAAYGDADAAVPLPETDAASTARWIERALAGGVAIPTTLQQQIDTIAALCAAERRQGRTLENGGASRRLSP
ncbi:DNA-binding protein YbiB [Lysobacter sp. CFH 32150]|uniref:DNA-binding protein YbiB n=1 Tax=Lysobacter sp. CFH 32150 TaxID=2927128 RepID=UPI001FA777C8|nr:DNA-binding protein YbiB [Lysobacter sp. CFH 32150]MCI4567026.1 DNA-binding protein YbiB [Lysobacter sp. CFH 32150]